MMFRISCIFLALTSILQGYARITIDINPINIINKASSRFQPRNDTVTFTAASSTPLGRVNRLNKPAMLVSKLAAATSSVGEKLSYLQTMTAGALSRSMAQTLLHPAHTYKTLLQLRDNTELTNKKLTMERLFRGADAQFLMSLPHGAFHFFVIDQMKQFLGKYMSPQLDFLADFSSSSLSTVVCSVISTPQMLITDRLMAGLYPSFPAAVQSIFQSEGVAGFYHGWWPALAQKIPSYGLTWMFFQQLKRSYEDVTGELPTGKANYLLGALAAAGSVSAMNPLDTVKTRLVTQTVLCPTRYKGVTDCMVRMVREEGVGSLYRSLPPRLLSVVPMIALQFGLYEGLKHHFQQHNIRQRLAAAKQNLLLQPARLQQRRRERREQLQQLLQRQTGRAPSLPPLEEEEM